MQPTMFQALRSYRGKRPVQRVNHTCRTATHQLQAQALALVAQPTAGIKDPECE